MANADAGPVSAIPPERCWELIASQSVGRLATSVERTPDISPINFVVDGHSIVFRTAEGAKFFALTINPTVAFEVDAWGHDKGWSVVVKGTAEQVTGDDDLSRAEALPLFPWVPTVKLHYVRITPTEISGRSFSFGPEPERNYAEP